METIRQLTYILQAIVPVGAAARIAYCLNAINVDPDEETSYKKRIRNALVFTVLAEVITLLLRVVLEYL